MKALKQFDKAKFARLVKYFEQVDDTLQYGTPTFTGRGFFVGSDLKNINQGFKQLIKAGVISDSKLFLDAGCGDGRVLALLSMYGIPSIGVEFSNDIFYAGRHHIDKLTRQKIIDKSLITMLLGDFMDDNIYRSAGFNFQNIPVIYNFLSNHAKIASKIANQSKKKTRFLLYGDKDNATEFEGLRLEESVELIVEGDRFIHVYKK